ncbi:DNA-binding transcriptional LysR family regulator [Sphingomonas naasensis]|uniref:LysR family transcriptional regulator n=1 Tax=Sphingomonas naasensis TaxID=1344951 RepID=A0A4S1WPU7_9SPHN|nr:LysR family transcriptional regulator [Sphingomonas naasensis]NIJ20895.1 DNA-binding transcriptional LysR family regulator [Sphingomonas naasensis]TGX43286.1 LysR family transcriptional regulator [Sphingomonas naasensis]
MLDWDHLRHFLAVARHGSTIAAARALGVNQSTVQRRLMALEAQLGQPVMTRTPAGYALTSFGALLLPQAEAVDAAVKRLMRQAGEAAHIEAGLIRVTCPEPIVPRLMPLIERFQALHPEFQVEFVTSDRYLDLARGDADVAFRSGDTDADLIGRKIADSVWAVYASNAYVDRRGAPANVADLARHSLVTFDETLSQHRVVAWLREVAGEAHVAARVNSVLGLLQAVRSGIGIAPLPANIADADPALVRLFGPVPELARTWKLLTTRALRRTARVSALFDFVANERQAIEAILS